MGHESNGELGSICRYAKSKYEERVEQKRGRRSQSAPNVAGRASTSKLLKSPKPQAVRTVSEKPRNRLRKQTASQLPLNEPTLDLYVLEFEPDKSTTEPGKVLGIYSSFDSVTLGALKHGAYTFSREGILDGNEYLSRTGRIKFVKTSVQHAGVRAHISKRSISPSGGQVRLDIPHPASAENRANSAAPENASIPPHDTVFVASRTGPRAASWIGVFASKSLAWGACLKDKALCAVTMPLVEEVRSIGPKNMPHVSGRLAGTGRFTWGVEEHAIDGSPGSNIVSS